LGHGAEIGPVPDDRDLDRRSGFCRPLSRLGEIPFELAAGAAFVM
jgi:hypothetical protein